MEREGLIQVIAERYHEYKQAVRDEDEERDEDPAPLAG